MQKVLLDYEPSTGQIQTKEGLYVGVQLGLSEFTESNTLVDSLIKLKNAGFSADEMIELNRKGLI